MKTYTLKEIVRQGTGPIRPLGESNADAARLENIGQFIEVVEELIEDLKDVARTRENGEASIVLIKRRAKKCLASLSVELAEWAE